jgi:hypothetical protein
MTIDHSLASKSCLRAIVALVCLGTVECRPASSFADTRIPDPPRQNQPWTPPQTKLPQSLVSATADLFKHGLADPRGCEYREVEVNDGQIRKTRGFVLPERAGEAGRFVVGWDAIVYRAQSVGAAADLDKDVRTLAAPMIRSRQTTAAKKSKGGGNAGGIFHVQTYRGVGAGGGPSGFDGPASVDRWSPLKVCLLLRLGRADLAEVVFAAGTAWTVEARGRDFADYRISYVWLATEWAGEAFSTLLNAHIRGDDLTALGAARRLSVFAKAFNTKADALARERGQGERVDTPSLPFLRRLPELLADQERRAREPARGPIPRRGGDPAARIAALIRNLDQIDEPQMLWSGGLNPGGSPLVRALIAEGDVAVDPLLSALESDTRLTRSVSFGRPGSIDRTVLPVSEALLSALGGILETTEFRDSGSALREGGIGPRKALANLVRTFWVNNRGIPLAERRYRTLLDDAAGLYRWLDAAREIVEPISTSVTVGWTADVRPRKPAPPPMKGEELRSRRDPSVSELLARRVSDIARTGNPLQHPDVGLHRASELTLIFCRWDPKAALPSVRDMMAQCREVIELRRERGAQADEGLAGFLSQFAVIRATSGGHEALGEYALWIRKTSPRELQHQSLTCFEPMWIYPDNPGIAATARWLFNDPQSPWLPMLRSPLTYGIPFFFDGSPYASPLLRVAGFRDSLLATLADRSEIGTVSRSAPGSFQYVMKDEGSGGSSTFKRDLEDVAPGVALPFRVCDYLAWQISVINGAPEFELYWPEDRRDRAVESCMAFLKRFGDRFTAEPPDGERDLRPRKAHVAFPPLGRPATLEDVRSARAIFSLDPKDDEVRIAKVPELPIAARWTTLKDYAYDRPRSDGTVHRQYDQQGWIWQAEEIKKGDRWERYFGFVGSHVIARVPASEIEIGDERTRNFWAPLAGGLDVRIESAQPRESGYQPGQPVLIALKFRNRRGVEQPAPTEFLRQGSDGRPALRRGVTLAVFYSSPGVSRTVQAQVDPWQELKPKRTARFDPGDASRPLAAFEEFEAARLDLVDWFDLTKPGSYRVRVKFAADSGVGGGTSNDTYFRIADLEDTIP